MVSLMLAVEAEFDLRIPEARDDAAEFPLDFRNRHAGCTLLGGALHGAELSRIMPLDPHAKRFLDMAAAGGRAGHFERHAGRNAPTRFSDWRGRWTAGRAEPGQHGEHRSAGARRARCRSASIRRRGRRRGASPGLIYFHGGGWVFGNLDTHDGDSAGCSPTRSGCRVIAVDYRLAPEHEFPAAVEDATRPRLWVADNAGGWASIRRASQSAAIPPAAISRAVVCQARRQRRTRSGAAGAVLSGDGHGAETESRRAFAAGYFLDSGRLIDWSLRPLSAGRTSIRPIRAFRRCAPPTLPACRRRTSTPRSSIPCATKGKPTRDRLEHAGVPVRYTCHRRHDSSLLRHGRHHPVRPHGA